AALGYLDRKVLVYRCGGTIISDQFVLTAAHCIRKNYKPTIVRLGKASLLDESNDTITAVMHNIQDIFVHPDYNATTMWNDIALLQVIDKIIFNDLVSPACLHSNLGDLPSNVPLTVTGWGTTDWRRSTTPSKYLLKVNLTSMPLEECKSKLITGPRVNDTSLRNGLFNGQYCAYGDAEKDACHGDSGGPLTYLRTNTSTIVGVVSFGYGCGLDIPSIYTRVSHYLDWIEPHVWSNLDNSN
ncbi:serine protease Hayan-like, partial [Contarinia nasturtii]|uniref:serine protease Hayan-like n=1 Tax=Contarinia nasturtii TaxID=265458 RepID=UPI0012D42E72